MAKDISEVRVSLSAHQNPKIDKLLLGSSRNRFRPINGQRTEPQTTSQLSTLKTSCCPAGSQSLPDQISIVASLAEKVGELANERSILHYLSHKILIANSKFRGAPQPDGTTLAVKESVWKIVMALFFTCQHAYGAASRALSAQHAVYTSHRKLS